MFEGYYGDCFALFGGLGGVDVRVARVRMRIGAVVRITHKFLIISISAFILVPTISVPVPSPIDMPHSSPSLHQHGLHNLLPLSESLPLDLLKFLINFPSLLRRVRQLSLLLKHTYPICKYLQHFMIFCIQLLHLLLLGF